MPMNVLFLTSQNPYGSISHGGAETSCRLLAEALAARGHRVWYLTNQTTEPERAKAARAGVRLLSPPRLCGQRLRPVRWVAARLPWWFSRFVATAGRIQIIYTYYEPLMLSRALRLRTQRRRMKVIMRMAGLFWYRHSLAKAGMVKEYENWFNAVDSVNFISSGLVGMTADRFDELGMAVNFADSFVHDIGSSAPIVPQPLQQPSRGQPLKLVMVGRLAPAQKRQDLLIRALALTPPSLRISLTLIGDGPTRTALAELAADLGIANRVVFVPFVPQSELWPILAEHHALCHCTDDEGLAKAVIEAMALGLPVIVSDVAPLNQYVRDQLTGFVVANDASAWASRLVSIVESPDECARVARAAIDYVRRKYDPINNVVIYEEHFRRILHNRPSTATFTRLNFVNPAD